MDNKWMDRFKNCICELTTQGSSASQECSILQEKLQYFISQDTILINRISPIQRSNTAM